MYSYNIFKLNIFILLNIKLKIIIYAFLGIIKFTRSVVAFEKDDRVVADLHRQIRSFYLPPVNVSSAVTSHV
jgi:NAD/NADP transhydrogenase beta subunit